MPLGPDHVCAPAARDDSITIVATMQAAVTRGRGAMEVVGVDEPGAPGPGQVLVAPEAVGLCGSDFHYFLGDIGTIDDPAALYPRIQGHEAAGTILEVGPDCPSGLVAGGRASRSGRSHRAVPATRAASVAATRARTSA